MNAALDCLLAQDEALPGIIQLLVFVFVVVLLGILGLLKRAKEWAERERARQEQQYGRPPAQQQAGPPRPPREALLALREVLGVEPEEPAAPTPRVPRPVQQRPKPKLRRPRTPPRRGTPEELGEGVRREVTALEAGLTAEEMQRQRRLRELERLRSSIGKAQTADELTPAPRVQVELTSPEEARRAILYSEILGPPKGLRRGPESWER